MDFRKAIPLDMRRPEGCFVVIGWNDVDCVKQTLSSHHIATTDLLAVAQDEGKRYLAQNKKCCGFSIYVFVPHIGLRHMDMTQIPGRLDIAFQIGCAVSSQDLLQGHGASICQGYLSLLKPSI